MGILKILSDARREPDRSFLVIGGFAVNAHGFTRFTVDLDILISREFRDFWEQVALGGGYTLLSRQDTFSQFTPPGQGPMPLDFMVVNDPTFKGMFAESVAGSLDGVAVKHPSLRHLLALKLHAIKQGLPHRELRDLYDVIQLVDINKVDTKSADFKQMCEKYGDSKTYETILKAPR